MKARRRLAAAFLLFAVGLGGCVSVPAAVKAEFAPPDGKRPNHYAKREPNPPAKWEAGR